MHVRVCLRICVSVRVTVEILSNTHTYVEIVQFYSIVMIIIITIMCIIIDFFFLFSLFQNFVYAIAVVHLHFSVSQFVNNKIVV